MVIYREKGAVMDRISLHHLRGMVDAINKVAGTPPTPYEGKGLPLRPQPGNYHLDECNGGVALCQMCSAGSGTWTVIDRDTKRGLYGQLRAFLAGLNVEKRRPRSYSHTLRTIDKKGGDIMISDILSDATFRIEEFLNTTDFYQEAGLRKQIEQTVAMMEEMRKILDTSPDTDAKTIATMAERLAGLNEMRRNAPVSTDGYE